ncbi:MAG: hypothetical protein ACD_75C01159G0003 [uncultured bacterium]|nr:MAG: hypothetical protein ACD_75C01159G0003 [uncultured bacterium]
MTVHRPAENLHVNGVVHPPPGTVFHAEIRADSATNRCRQRGVPEDQLIRLLDPPFTDEPQSVDRGNMDRAIVGARRSRFAVGPIGFFSAQVAADNHADGASVESRSQVSQWIAAEFPVPVLVPEFGHGHGTREHEGPFLGGNRHQDMPFFPLREEFEQLGFTYFFEKADDICGKPLPLFIAWGSELGIGFRIGVIGFAAKIDGAADHPDTGTVAENVVGIFRLDAADNRNSAAVELGKGIAGRAEDPEFRPFELGIPLGHGQTAGADGAADEYLAVGHGVARTVGGIAQDRDFRADIEIADVVRGRTFTDDGGAGHTHAAEPLSGRALDRNVQAVFPLQADADIMLAIRLEQKVGGRGCCLPHQFLEFH